MRTRPCHLCSTGRPYCSFFFRLLQTIPVLFFLVSVDQPDATKLRTAVLLHHWTPQALARCYCRPHRSPFTAILSDTLNPVDRFSFPTYWPPGLVHYYVTSGFGWCCAFLVWTPRPARTLSPRRDDLVLAARRVLFSIFVCVVFSGTPIFVPYARRARHVWLSFRYRFCASVEHKRRSVACKTIASGHPQLLRMSYTCL